MYENFQEGNGGSEDSENNVGCGDGGCVGGGDRGEGGRWRLVDDISLMESKVINDSVALLVRYSDGDYEETWHDGGDDCLCDGDGL